MKLILALLLCGVGLLFLTFRPEQCRALATESEKHRWLRTSFRLICVLTLIFGGIVIYRNTVQRDVSAFDRRKVLTSISASLFGGAALGAIIIVGLAGGFRKQIASKDAPRGIESLPRKDPGSDAN